MNKIAMSSIVGVIGMVILTVTATSIVFLVVNEQDKYTATKEKIISDAVLNVTAHLRVIDYLFEKDNFIEITEPKNKLIFDTKITVEDEHFLRSSRLNSVSLILSISLTKSRVTSSVIYS